MSESDWIVYISANCPFEKGVLLYSSSRGIYKCSICFREFTDSQITPYRTIQPAQEKQSTAVTGTFFQPIQPVSGTLTTTPPVNASTNLAQVGGSSVSLGAKTAANSIPVVLASDETALPVTGTFFQPTQPVSAASLPLAMNAAQETGGNLATVLLQTRNDAQIVDVLNCILAQLKLLNLNLASAIPSAHTDIDTWVMDSLPTFH